MLAYRSSRLIHFVRSSLTLATMPYGHKRLWFISGWRRALKASHAASPEAGLIFTDYPNCANFFTESLSRGLSRGRVSIYRLSELCQFLHSRGLSRGRIYHCELMGFKIESETAVSFLYSAFESLPRTGKYPNILIAGIYIQNLDINIFIGCRTDTEEDLSTDGGL